MQNYTVLVDALGYTGGCARKGEVVTVEQVGEENIARLLNQGFIYAAVVPEAAVPEAVVPEVSEQDVLTLKDYWLKGQPAPEEYKISQADEQWIIETRASGEPLELDLEYIRKLTIPELKKAIESFGWEPANDQKKAVYIQDLCEIVKDAFDEYVCESESRPENNLIL